MKTKLTALLLSVLCLTTLLAGCVRTELGVALHDDGTGVITTTVAVKEDAYNTMKQSGTDPFDGRTTEKVTYDDTAYISCSEVTERLSYEELETQLKAVRLDASDEESPLLFSDVSIEKNGGLFYNSFTFKAKTAAQIDTGEDQMQDVNGMYKFFVKVTMPGSISQTKDGVVEGNTVTFAIEDLTQENEFAVYSDSNNVGVVIGIIVVMALILGAILFFVKKKG